MTSARRTVSFRVHVHFQVVATLLVAWGSLAAVELPEPLEAAFKSQNWLEAVAQAEAWQGKGVSAEEQAAALYWEGQARVQLNHKHAASQVFAKSLQLLPSIATARAAADLAFKNTDWTTLEKLAKEWPEDAEIRFLTGSYADWWSSVEYRKKTPEGYRNSITFERLARSHLEAAVVLDPRHAKAHYKLAQCLRVQEQPEEALKHLKMARNLGTLKTQELELVARQYATFGDYDAAAEVMAEAFEMAQMYDPRGFTTYPKAWADQKRIDYLVRAGRTEEATEGIRNLLQRDRLDNRARSKLGDMAYKAGDYRLALFGYREGWAHEEVLDSLVGIARCLLDLEQYQAARSAIEQVFVIAEEKEKKTVSTWHFIRGRCLWEEGKRKEAAQDFHKAVRLNKTRPEFMEWGLHAAKEMDDPIGALYLARFYGLYRDSNADDAIEVLQAIPEIWPQPKVVSPLGPMGPYGSTNHAYRYIAEIELKRRNFKTAYAFYQKSGGKQFFGTEGTWEGWIAFHAGDLKLAEELFTINIRMSPHQLDWSQFGLAVTSMHQEKWDAAKKAADSIPTGSNAAPFAPLLKSWIALHSEDEADVPDLDMLGIAASKFEGSGEFGLGMQVEALLPGSPLEKVSPRIQPGDVLVLVGDYPIRDANCLNAARAVSFSDHPMKLLFRRPGSDSFEIEFDFAQARSKTAILAAD